MPNNLISGLAVQDQAEGTLVLPHLSGHIVTMPQLVSKAVAVCIKEQASNTTESLSSEPLFIFNDYDGRVTKVFKTYLNLGVRLRWIYDRDHESKC